ncbi:MAG: phospholipase [Rhodanobacter sp.]
MPTELEREQAQLQQLRARHDPAAQRAANHLQVVYHDRQMELLAEDVYLAAKGEGHPPPGWARLSEHPELVSQYAARLNVDKDKLLDELKPDTSGFRAEIYLPDAALHQAGYKPTLALKGSSGEVMTSDGKTYDTTAEDFGANNFPQSVGMETDYYDRAMALAYQLKRYNIDFESTGHSLAGGMVAAAAAVTDTRATTFNAAGLNPATAQRFAQQHPDVTVHKDLTHLITNYQVQGELLSDGVQNNIHNMDILQRLELGGVLKEASDVLQRVPEARAVFAQKLSAGLPPQAQETVHAFVDKIATGDTRRMLQELPLAAGEQHVLPAMTRDLHGHLVKREQVMSLPETTLLAAPLLESLAVVVAGARIGERGGESVVALGQLESQGLHAAGRGVEGMANAVGAREQAMTRTEGAIVQSGVHVAGAGLVEARTAQAEAGARVVQGLGQATQLAAELDAAMLRGTGHLLPGQARDALQRQATYLQQAGLEAQRQGASNAAAVRQAGRADVAAIRGATQTMETVTLKSAEAYGAAQHAVIGGAGRETRERLDTTAQDVETATRRAPTAFAATGAAAGLSVAAALELNAGNYPRLAGAATALSQGRRVGSEAFERHLMMPSITPSMDAHVQALEREAEQILRRPVPEHAPNAQRHDTPAHASVGSPFYAGDRVFPVDQAYPRLAQHTGPQLRDFSSPGHPQHALYNTLKAGLPSDTTPAWLAHATGVCYMSGIKRPDDLGNVYGNGERIMFASHSPLAQNAMIDTSQAPPAVQQTMQQVRQYDQQQAQMMGQIQAQNAQLNQQGLTPGGR